MIDFLDWYALYPRKVARAAAQKAWAKLTLPERQQAIDALPAHVHRWRMTATPWDYLPHPSTWLTQQRFADELPNNGGSPARKDRPTNAQPALSAPSVMTIPPSINAASAPVPLQAQPVRESPPCQADAGAAPTIRLATGPRSMADIIGGLKQQLKRSAG